MQRYGIVVDGKLRLVPEASRGAKPVKWTPLPEYDQETQAIFEKPPVDKGDYILVELEVRNVEQDEGEQADEMF